METTTDRLLVPYDEAMHALGGIGRTKFYDLIDNGYLERVSIGRRGFITAASLTRYVNSLSQPVEVDGQLPLFDEPPHEERKLAAVTRRRP